MDGKLRQVLDRWLARRVWNLWAYPDVVREWIDTGNPALSQRAHREARAVHETLCYGPALGACEVTIRALFDPLDLPPLPSIPDLPGFPGFPLPFWETLGELVCDVVVSAKAREGRGTPAEVYKYERDLRDKEEAAHTRVQDILTGGTRDEPDSLLHLIQTCGLAARHLDVVREDPWLTREVVRAYNAPDLDVWCDWAAELLMERGDLDLRLKCNWTQEDELDARNFHTRTGEMT